MDKNLQEALKWIYASLGGDITDLAAVDDITVILNAIADLDTVQKIKSATELPDVSDVDDGDVLTVVDGEWAKAEPSGGGSSLPSVSSTDVGKVMRVQNGATATVTTIVPEQTVANTGENVELENAVVSAFVAGTKITATINNKAYSGYLASWFAGVGCEWTDEQTGEYFEIGLSDGAVYFYAESDAETFTVSVTKTDYNAVWGVNSDFDLAIQLENDGNTLDDATGATIIGGSYDDVADKLAAGKPASVYVMDKGRVQALGGLGGVAVALDHTNNIQVSLFVVGMNISAYVASSSGGSATTQVSIPRVFTYDLYVHPDGTIRGWWDD